MSILAIKHNIKFGLFLTFVVSPFIIVPVTVYKIDPILTFIFNK